MPSTPNLNLPYPAATDAPDGPGAFYNLATAFDNVIVYGGLAGFFTPATGVTLNAANLNSVVSIGKLRIVNLSLVSSTPISAGTNLGGMNVGHRPYQPVWAGAQIIDGSTYSAGSAYLTDNGSIGVGEFIPDAGTDGKFTELRCTFVYPAV